MRPLRERKGFRGYGAQEERPLGAYALLVGMWNLGLGGLVWLAGRRRAPRMDIEDVLLFGLATHKLTRLVARDGVTSPLRAPFTRFQKKAAAAEVEETSRGEGLRRAVGDLVSCPFCLGPWVALGLTSLHVVRPEAAHAVGSVFALTAISDFLHRAYEWEGAGLHRTEASERAAEAEAEVSEQRRAELAGAEAH